MFNGPTMANATIQALQLAWKRCDDETRRQAISLYQELCDSGVFKVTWEQFLFYKLLLSSSNYDN